MVYRSGLADSLSRFRPAHGTAQHER